MLFINLCIYSIYEFFSTQFLLYSAYYSHASPPLLGFLVAIAMTQEEEQYFHRYLPILRSRAKLVLFRIGVLHCLFLRCGRACCCIINSTISIAIY